MSESQWRLRARAVIVEVLAGMPAGTSRKSAAKAIAPAYPFGPRANHPYRIWLSEVKRQLDAKYGREDGCSLVDLRGAGPHCNGQVGCDETKHCFACCTVWEKWHRLGAVLHAEFKAIYANAKLGDEAAILAAHHWAEENGLPEPGGISKPDLKTS